MAQLLCDLQTQSDEGNWSETGTDGNGQKEIQMVLGLTGNISPYNGIEYAEQSNCEIGWMISKRTQEIVKSPEPKGTSKT